MELQRRSHSAQETDMKDAQFEALLSRLDRIAAALERLAPAAHGEAAAPVDAAAAQGAQPDSAASPALAT